jgi:succinoglycan biosynthesis protein ExoM
MHISVCICSYQRPALLRRLLLELSQLQTHGLFTYSVVIADNDPGESGRPVVAEMVSSFPTKITYCTEPRRSIAHARNKALENATGEAIAFIDDDEFPEKDWLDNLHTSLVEHKVAGVLGPVRPYFEHVPPAWVIKGRFCERPEQPTGYALRWTECRTGNVLFKREIVYGINPVFLPELGTAGSDVNFFWRMMKQGHKFIWCNEAVVYEVVPPSRCRRRFMLKRALLRGGNYLKHPEGRWRALATSALAVPAYTVMLPFLQLAGHHHFMKYLVKWCDHAARLLSVFGVKLVKQREM